MANGVGEQYRKKSTILGDEDFLFWQKEQEDLRRARERKHKMLIIDRMPGDVKSKPFNGVEREQVLRGMSLLEIYKRRMRRQ